MKKQSVWMLVKWLPNRTDPQIGVFIQKHAIAIAESFDVYVLYVQSLSGLKSVIEIDERETSGVKETLVYFRKCESIYGKVLNFFRYYKALRKGISALNRKNKNPDFIHSYILLRTGIVAWYLSKTKKTPYLVSEQWSGYVTGKYEKSFFLKKMLTKFVIRNASAVTAVSAFLSGKMKEQGLHNHNYHVTPNIIESPSDNVSKKSSEKVSILLVADLVDEIKNISAVIKMIAGLETDISFELKIIGHGPDETKLKKLATDSGLLNTKIFFEGVKRNEDVYEYLMRCDFLLMNSRYETFSLICAEAMSCGKPVLATRCGGPNEFVTALTGVLIEPDDDSELRNKFLWMLNHYVEYDSASIKSYAKGLFSRQHVALLFKDIYDSILPLEK